MTILTGRSKGTNSDVGVLQDSALQTGGITVDQDAYSTDPDSTTLDRVYDVKGLDNMHVEIENTGGANGLTYTIVNARKEFTNISTLVDADFDEEILADTNVAFGATNIQDVIDITPETTAIRIKIKRQTAGLDTTLAGIVSIN